VTLKLRVFFDWIIRPTRCEWTTFRINFGILSTTWIWPRSWSWLFWSSNVWSMRWPYTSLKFIGSISHHLIYWRVYNVWNSCTMYAFRSCLKFEHLTHVINFNIHTVLKIWRRLSLFDGSLLTGIMVWK